VAVSLEFDEHAHFDKAAAVARSIIEQILSRRQIEPQLYNVNIPTAALTGNAAVRTVPMDVSHYGERFERRVDPWGRPYYWATGEPPPRLGEQETDLTALKRGFITVTPLDYNMTKRAVLADMQGWDIRLEGVVKTSDGNGNGRESGPIRRPIVRVSREKSTRD
jgi:5'-nucleotidase